MNRKLNFKKYLVTGILCLFCLAGVNAQSANKEVYKKYILKDSSGVNKSAIIIFYTDNTFLNFGIFDDKKALEIFVWYKEGRWSMNNNTISCSAPEKGKDTEQLKKQIKQYYKTRRDRVLIETYYEFVHEDFRDGQLSVTNEQASDSEKKIDYTAVN